MKNDKVKFLLAGLFFIVLAMITFRCVFGPDQVFAASDLNIGRLAAKKSALPEMLTGYFTANQVLGGGGANLTLFNILMAAMPLELFANVFYGMVLVFGSLSMLWFLRLWNRSWIASIFGALIAFWFNSIMLAAGGHAYKMEVLGFSVLSLCLIEKAIRTASGKRVAGYSILAGLAIGIMMIEQPDVALLAGLFIGSYTFFRLIQKHLRNPLRWLGILAPIAIFALLLAGQTLIGSYKYNIAGAAAVQQKDKGDAEAKWNYITQWSMVPGEWVDLIASGWSGWSSNNPKGPYWGKVGQSAEWETTKQGFRNFKLTSNYIGFIPFLLGAFGFIVSCRSRKDEEGAAMLFWCIAGLLGFMLAFGKYSLLYKLFYQLPLVGNIRGPSKLMDNFQICLGIVAAYGLDQLLADGKSRMSGKFMWIVSASCAVLMLLAGFMLHAFPAARAREFSVMGFEAYSDIMVQNMANAWLHAGLLALICGGLVFLIWKGWKMTTRVGLIFVVVLTMDSLVLTSHYFRADNIASVKQGNILINYLKENQGNERAFFMDSGGIYNQWVASDGPFHDLNLFNIWQMPRMPVEYKQYLGVIGRNPPRLWEFSAIRHIAAPAEVVKQWKKDPAAGKLIKPVLSYRVPTREGMRDDVLVEFLGSIPRFSLFHGWESLPMSEHCEKMISPTHNERSTLLVDSAFSLKSNPGTTVFVPLEGNVTKRNAVVEVETDKPGILRFSQRYQANWTVLVNNEEADLLRVDYLSMGVKIPSGRSVVEFQCPRNTRGFTMRVGFFLASSGLATFLLIGRKKEESVGS